jgi:hypothetical protein
VDDAFKDLIGYSVLALGLLQEKAKVSEPDADEAIAASEAPEIWEWQWACRFEDSDTTFFITDWHYTEKDIERFPLLVEKIKLPASGRRRPT